MEILLTLNGEQTAPHTLEEVQALLASGEATMEDYAWWDGCEDWVTIADIPGISEGGLEAEATEEPAEEEPAGEATAEIYVFPEGAEDWDGPHTLAHIQEMVANEEAAETDFAAYEGSAEGSTVADIPGFADAAAAAQEEPAEEELVEEEPAVPAKKMGMKKGGFKKGGLAKKGASGFGAKKSAGAAIKKGAAKKGAGTAKKAAKSSTPPVVVGDGEISDKSFTSTYIVACFLGTLGIHRFMVGKVGTGVAMLLTVGGLGIWALIDIIMIALGNFKDKEGRPIVTKQDEGSSDKNLGVILLLFHFLGGFGIHRFMAGKIGTGIAFLLTLGGVGIWALIDWISMASGNFKDKEGRPIRHIL